MSALRIYPYKSGSESAKELSVLLNALRVRPDGDYVPKVGQICLNWGSSRTPDWASRAASRGVRMLNKVEAVNKAANKLTTLQILSNHGIRVPEFTTSMSVAQGWVRSGHTVVERHELRGNSGAGIRIVNLDDDEMDSVINSAPLYTKYIPKTAEFRVHVFNNQVIDYIEKKRVASERRGVNFNKYICSNELGWVFARNNVRDIPEVRTLALNAVRTLGLDFAAVDIVYHAGIPYVLELNTAPGLTGTTLVKYANALRRFLGISDLSQDVVNQVMAKTTETPEVAAHMASVTTRGPVAPASTTNSDEVVLRLDRTTARKLKSLLLGLNL